MGCDIHIWAEQKKDGRWELITGLPVDRWLVKVMPDEYKATDTDAEGWLTSVRCYRAFSVLADVRNGRDVHITPIHPRRGLPIDSLNAGRFMEGYEGYGHSPSWATLRELLSYPWHTVEYVEEFLDESVLKLARRLWSPSEACVWWARDILEGDKTALVPLHDYLEEHSLPGLDDVRCCYYFDN